MKTVHFFRRLHLYLGLALAPWILMYGVSSIPFAHPAYFQQRDQATGRPLWTVEYQRPYSVQVPAGSENLREFAQAVLTDLGIEAPNIGASRPNADTVNVIAYSFLRSTRVILRQSQQTVTVEHRRFRFDQFLTGMHARGGFVQDGLLNDLWGVIVDVVGAAMILWIMTGLILWWRIRSHRRWGLVAVGAGTAAFLVFALQL